MDDWRFWAAGVFVRFGKRQDLDRSERTDDTSSCYKQIESLEIHGLKCSYYICVSFLECQMSSATNLKYGTYELTNSHECR